MSRRLRVAPHLRGRRLLAAAVGCAAIAFGLLPAAAAADFGAAEFQAAVSNRDGSSATQAGSHPYQLTMTLTLDDHLDPAGDLQPDGAAKDVLFALPAGLIGDPDATPRCPVQSFSELDGNDFGCPSDTQIGTVVLSGGGAPSPSAIPPLAVYNVVPPPGVPAAFGFEAFSADNLILSTVRTGGDSGLDVGLDDLAQVGPLLGFSVTLWGVPADPAHDPERVCPATETRGCSSDAPPRPFLTMPTSCAGPLSTGLSLDSWEEPGRFVGASYPFADESGGPGATSGCDRLDFSPSLSVLPDSSVADSPTGLHLDLRLPQDENPVGLAEANLRDLRLQLPPGLSINPAAADGLAGCAQQGGGGVNLPGSGEPAAAEAAKCPAAAKIATAEVETPLLERPLLGAVYLAQPWQNPFDSLLAVYLSVEEPRSGVVVKLAGEIEADPGSGRLSASFEQVPQLPLEALKLDFFSGPRALLRTPATCGVYATGTDLVPWSAPEAPDAIRGGSFTIGAAPAGGACPGTEAQLPDQPDLVAGTTPARAGYYAPFVLGLSRADGSQQLGALQATLPRGLLVRLAGVPYCPAAGIAAAQAPGHGAAPEQAEPSCPPASQVGTVTIGAGAGPDPIRIPGKVYLAGPYRGAPLSLVTLTPALAGPFDLGTVVVRAGLRIDPRSARVTVTSDPLPTILEGIPLDIRSLDLDLDRPEFTRNPTSCAPTTVLGAATSVLGQVASLSSPFGVGGCAGLAFRPRLTLGLGGPTRRGGNPALTATLTDPEGGAGIARAELTMPGSELLDDAHVRAVCTGARFAAGTTPGEECPPASIYGHIKAITPLLSRPLAGPVYLRSSPHRLPDLVAALDGQFSIVLDGRIDTGRGGGIRTTFEGLPDAPISRLTLSIRGGRRGLLVNSENICAGPQRATVELGAQNGKTSDMRPLIADGCGGGKRKERGGK